jgi:hypothetical protein
MRTSQGSVWDGTIPFHLIPSLPMGQTFFFIKIFCLSRTRQPYWYRIDVFLVHSNDIVINERRTALAPEQVDDIFFIHSKESMLI